MIQFNHLQMMQPHFSFLHADILAEIFPPKAWDKNLLEPAALNHPWSEA